MFFSNELRCILKSKQVLQNRWHKLDVATQFKENFSLRFDDFIGMSLKTFHSAKNVSVCLIAWLEFRQNVFARKKSSLGPRHTLKKVFGAIQIIRDTLGVCVCGGVRDSVTNLPKFHVTKLNPIFAIWPVFISFKTLFFILKSVS
jgi:hypothetical protein